MKKKVANKLPWLILISFLTAKLLVDGFSQPLAEVHWDSVVHLYNAKRFAETAMLRQYAQHASAISAEVRVLPEGEFSAAYWRFSRLGHIVFLGMIVKMFGTGAAAIIAAHWLYNILMPLTVLSAIILVIALANYYGVSSSQKVVLWSALGSSVLYTMSPIYDYMGRSLISEVPAMLMLTLAGVLLVVGLDRRSRLLACLSGLVAFLAYTIRLESIWIFISFCAVLATAGYIRREREDWVLAYAFAGSSAFACYIFYAWLFYPLGNPYLFIIFAQSQPPWYGTVPLFINITATGGLLWIGALASLIAAWAWITARMAFAWAVIALIPSLPYLFDNVMYGVPVQTRMVASILTLPIFISSTLGWAYLWEQRKQGLRWLFATMATLSFALVAGSMLVGVENVKYIRGFLMLPEYEAVTYWYEEINCISQAVYGRHKPAVLVYDDDLDYQNLSLIRFFGPAYPPQADLVMNPGLVSRRVPCKEIVTVPSALEQVSFCVGMTAEKLEELTERGFTVFSLSSSSNAVAIPLVDEELLHTQHYRLGIVMRG